MNKFKVFVTLLILFLNISVVQVYAAENSVYDFSDEAQALFDKNDTYNAGFHTLWGSNANIPGQNYKVNNDKSYTPSAHMPQNSDKKVFDGRLVYISKGTPIAARLNSTIDSRTVQNNTAVTAELTADWEFDGTLIAPEGSIISGSFVDTKKAGWALENGQIGLMFDKIIKPDGSILPLSANKVYITVEGSRVWDFSKNILFGAALGSLTGLILMDPSTITAGVIAGAAVGTVSGVATKGEDVNLPAGTNLQLRLSQDMTAEPYDF